MKTRYLIALGTIFLSVACSSEQETPSEEIRLNQRYDKLLADNLSSYAPLPMKADNEANPTNPTKVKLGQTLYYDTRLSLDGNNSCNSCHNLETYGVDNKPFSEGDLGGLGGRNSPTTLNAALHFKQFWDGRAHDVEEQAGGPVLNPVEMNIPSKDFMVKRLKEVDMYKTMFAQAFPEASNPISYENMQMAIGAFERELLTPSRFDQYLKGDKSALTVQEKKGLLSFTYIGCNSCHSGSLLGGMQFQRFGVHKPYWEATGSEKIDKGLAEVTGEELDEFLFKTPSLRNVTETHPYFHDGSVSELKQAIKIMAEIQLDYKMNANEIENVAAFMEALKGEVKPEFKKNPLAAL